MTKNPLQTLGKEWEILGVYFKPYSTCRLLHAAIDGVLDLTKEHKINVDDILKITVAVGVHAGAMTNYRPSDIWQAQYSIPFAIGAALLDREVGPEQIAKNRLTDKAILRQADKVELVDDPEVRALFPAVFAGRVTIEMKDSKKYETLKRYPRGEPQNPLSEEELAGKFRKLAAKALASDEIELLSRCLDRLEDYSIGELMGKLVGER
jgi:2-methylcitrate dehydratase PrpD